MRISTGAGDGTAGEVQQRFASISGQVRSGSFANRGPIWRGSWDLARNHPWYSFDELSFSWLRPVIGYGPDLFRYTFLLVSQPVDFNRIPLEPDHAHNYFVHQGVEQGLLGLVSSLGLFLTVFAWRETLLERTERVRRRSANTLVCPTCGYNLTSLREPTCPECGTVWALDELYGLQPGRDEGLS